MNEVMRSRVKWLVKLGVAAALLYFLFTFVAFTEVVDALGSADPAWLAAAFGVLFFERLVPAMKVKLLADQMGLGLSLWKILEINTVSVFYGTFLPGDLAGGAVRWYRMSKDTGLRAQAFAAIVFERVLDTIFLLLFGLGFWFWEGPSFATTAINGVVIALLGGLVLGISLSLSHHASSLLGWLVRWIPFEHIRHLVEEKLGKVLESVREFRRLSPSAVAGVLALTAARQMVAIAGLWCTARSLGLEISFVTLGWIRSFLSILTMLPVSFSGLGVREGGMVLLLRPYGFSGPAAVALSFLRLFQALCLAAVGGLLEARRAFFSGPSEAGPLEKEV